LDRLIENKPGRPVGKGREWDVPGEGAWAVVIAQLNEKSRPARVDRGGEDGGQVNEKKRRRAPEGSVSTKHEDQIGENR